MGDLVWNGELAAVLWYALVGEMDRELLLFTVEEPEGIPPLLCGCCWEEVEGRERESPSPLPLLPPVSPSKSNPEGPASPVGVTGAGVEHEPIRIAAFSSSRFFKHAALGFR